MWHAASAKPGASKRQAASRALPQALFLNLLFLGCASNQACAQHPVARRQQQQAQPDGGQCPLFVRYEVSLGQGVSASPQLPIFVASMSLQNNENVSGTFVLQKLEVALRVAARVPARLPASSSMLACWLGNLTGAALLSAKPRTCHAVHGR
jgi:hypothetical protein